jgi:hypothetical protein
LEEQQQQQQQAKALHWQLVEARPREERHLEKSIECLQGVQWQKNDVRVMKEQQTEVQERAADERAAVPVCCA